MEIVHFQLYKHRYISIFFLLVTLTTRFMYKYFVVRHTRTLYWQFDIVCFRNELFL